MIISEDNNFILQCLLSNDSVMERTRHIVNVSLFHEKLRPQLRMILSYYDQTGKLPPIELIENSFNMKFSSNTPDEEYAVMQVKGFCKYESYKNAIYAGPEILEHRDYDKLHKLIEAAGCVDEERDPWGFVFGDQLGQIDPPSFLIAPWLIKNTVTAMYGAPGSFKSFFVLDAALSLAKGLKGLGRVQVLYMAAEGANGINLRAEAWQQKNNTDLKAHEFVLLPKPIVLTNDANVTAFIKRIQKMERECGSHFGLVVIDTLSQCMPGADENSVQDMTLATSNMIRLRRELVERI